MCDQNDRHAFFPVQFMRRADDFLPPVRIKHGSRLVEHNALRFHRHDPGDRHALLLSAGELVRRMMTVREHPYRTKAFFHALPDLIRRHADIFRSEADILLHDARNDLVVRILKYHTRSLTHRKCILFLCDIPAIHPERAFARQKERVNVFCKRGFAGTVVS